MTYPIYKIIKGEQIDTIQRIDEDGKVWSIPIDETNSDYQAYLAAQSTPSVE